MQIVDTHPAHRTIVLTPNEQITSKYLIQALTHNGMSTARANIVASEMFDALEAMTQSNRQPIALATCNACRAAHSPDDLGTCLGCGTPICGLNGCTGECACGVEVIN